MTPKQTKALQCLITCRTKREAAAEAGIDEKTLRKYLNIPEFVTEYRRAFTSLIEDSTRSAQRAIQPALDVLIEIMQDSDTPAQARIQACRTILESAERFGTQLDVLDRLTALEKEAGINGKP